MIAENILWFVQLQKSSGVDDGIQWNGGQNIFGIFTHLKYLSKTHQNSCPDNLPHALQILRYHNSNLQGELLKWVKNGNGKLVFDRNKIFSDMFEKYFFYF